MIFECHAQKFIDLKTYNVDSLLLVLTNQQTEERVNSLNNLAASLYFKEYVLGEKYASEARKLAGEINYEKGLANAYRNLGHINQFQGKYPKALNNYFEALSLYEKLNSKHKVGETFLDISRTHYFANNYEKALEYGKKAMDSFREYKADGTKVGDVRDSISVFGGMTEIYWKMGMFDKSLEYGLKTVEILKRSNPSNMEVMINTWAAGASLADAGEFESAKNYFLKALSYPDESLDMQTLKYRNTISLGWLNFSMGEIDSALYFLQTAFDFYNEKGFLFWAMSTSMGLGYIYFNNNEFDFALKYLQQSEKIFNEMIIKDSWYRHDSLEYIANYGLELYFPLPPILLKEKMWENSELLFRLLFLFNTKVNNTDAALKYHIAYSDAKDTLNRLQHNRETVEMQTRYESERKDQQIETLSLENELKETRLDQTRYFFLGAVGLFIVLLMFVFILFRQNKIKTDQRLLGLQQKFFRSQMNPHFIFNSLASIQNIVVNHDSKKASIYLSRFSELIRSILVSTTDEYILLDKEVKTIENYLELQKLRFPDKFNYLIEVDDKLDLENLLIPPMLAQPIIENSIEHGIKHKHSSGNINIRISLKDKVIVYEVEDDGVGREKARDVLSKQNKHHKSLSTTITSERIQVLNKKLKEKISFEILDLKDDDGRPAGTRVVFRIPALYV